MNVKYEGETSLYTEDLDAILEETAGHYRKSLNIYQRINAVMEEVHYVAKCGKKVNGQYSFVSHDDVIGKLHEPLTRYGIVIVPSVVDHEREGDKGMRTVVELNVQFVNMDDKTDSFSINSVGYGIDTQDKGIGKAISYAYKYALLKVFCLETGDDVERDQIEYVPEKISTKQVSEIELLLDGKENRKADMLKYLKVKRLEDIPATSYRYVISALGVQK